MTSLNPDLEDDVLGLAEALRPALLRVSRRLRQEALKAGVSALDAQLLMIIRKNPGIGGAELAEREQMTRPSMSAQLKRLEATGWIARDPTCEADRRRVGVRLTANGEFALEAIRRRRNDWLAARLADLSPEARRALDAAVGHLARLADVI